MEEERDANAATFTWIFGFEGPPPHWLFLIKSVQFISLSFGGLSRGICSKAANCNCGIRPSVTRALLNTVTLRKVYGWL